MINEELSLDQAIKLLNKMVEQDPKRKGVMSTPLKAEDIQRVAATWPKLYACFGARDILDVVEPLEKALAACVQGMQVSEVQRGVVLPADMVRLRTYELLQEAYAALKRLGGNDAHP